MGNKLVVHLSLGLYVQSKHTVDSVSIAYSVGNIRVFSSYQGFDERILLRFFMRCIPPWG